jgi:FMN phosphatase YigB (HAD superfamily)
MKKIITTLCLLPSLIWGVVFESNQMEDALPYVEGGTWVLIDVDNTLIESTHTQKQIGSGAVDLTNDFPKRFSLPVPHPGLYERGVIYCGDNPKEEALIAFFQETGCMPEKVIFIDDRPDQVEKLEVRLEKLGIEFVGIRFSGADERVKAFDPAVADLQFSRLPTIISDDEAKKSLDSQ